jgi:hypothetical protein
MKKHVPFVFLNKGTPKVTFLKPFFLTTYLKYYIYYYLNKFENWNSTWLGQSFDIKLKWKAFKNESYVVLKLGGSQNLGCDIPNGTTQGWMCPSIKTFGPFGLVRNI